MAASPTLYVVVRGDYSQYQKDLARIRAIAKQNGEEISNALNNAISPGQAIRGLNSLAQAFKQIHVSAANVDKNFPIQRIYEFSRSVGMAAKDVRNLIENA